MTGHLDASGMDDAELAAYGLGAAALRYQRLGYAVLALGAGSKRPHRLFASDDGSPAGVLWATKDPAMVEYVWSRDRLAGIGVATGAASQLLVIDLDRHGEQNGEAEFAAFTDAWSLPMPPGGPVVHTPSGGKHIWLRLPPGVSMPSRTGILPGVDIKADGGYVVVPPSRIWSEGADRPGEHGSGRVLLPYRMAGCPCTVQAAPEWLAGWVRHTPGSGSGSGGGEDAPDLGELAESGLPSGERNITLHRLACSLYRKMGTGPGGDAAVRATLGPVLARTDMRGFGGSEFERALGSARRFVERSQQAEAMAWEDRWST